MQKYRSDAWNVSDNLGLETAWLWQTDHILHHLLLPAAAVKVTGT